MGKRNNSVMVRLDEERLGELEGMAEATGIPASTLAHNAVVALLKSYSENGFITSPIQISVTPATSAARSFELNEAPAGIPPMGHDLARLPGEPEFGNPQHTDPKKKSKAPKTGLPRATAALSESKPLPDAGTLSA